MEKHIHHLPHFISGILHSVAFLAAVFKTTRPREKATYLGDNFPAGIGCSKEKNK